MDLLFVYLPLSMQLLVMLWLGVERLSMTIVLIRVKVIMHHHLRQSRSLVLGQD